MIETSLSSAGGVGSNPDRGTNIPFASGSKNANENNRSNIVTHSIQALKIIYIKREIIVLLLKILLII